MKPIITPEGQLRFDVATVMGWTLEESNPRDRTCWHLNGIQSETAAPDYDTDLTAAMELVQFMRKKGFDFSLNCKRTTKPGSDGWCVVFNADHMSRHFRHPNPATAICRAFLACQPKKCNDS